jgi:signal transduction histidine kinase
LGLRLQIVLALAGLMALAFGPLFFAVASLTEATVLGSREQSARRLGHAVAVHVGDGWATGGSAGASRAMQVDSRLPDVEGVGLFDEGGGLVASAGAFDRIVLPGLGQRAETLRVTRGADGLAFQVSSPVAAGTVATLVRVDAGVDAGAALVRLVALYTTTFALALLLFAYFVLTRLIVRPIEQLARAADRVAGGARALRVPSAGARELLELSTSVQAMAKTLLASEASLLDKVRELTATTTRLTQTQAQLVRSERLASVGRLSAGLAHEIGNPIAALMGLEDLLLEGELPAETRDFVGRMRRETERIHRVVRDLLDFARPEAPAAALEENPTADVGAVVDDVAALVKPQKPFRGVRIEKAIEGAPRVALPASRLMQVLLNVVMNAGAALASSERADKRITVRAKIAAPSRVHIEVEDSGPGIAPELRDRVFEPFVTTKPVGDGTGLGLAVCRGLVESAGGEIGLDATYEEGARFTISLPAA